MRAEWQGIHEAANAASRDILAGEALTAATLNAACSLGLGADRGSLEPGKRADLLVTDLPNHLHLTYELGRNPVRKVVKDGRVVR